MFLSGKWLIICLYEGEEMHWEVPVQDLVLLQLPVATVATVENERGWWWCWAAKAGVF